MNSSNLLKWGPAILAALTALLDVGHISGIVASEVIVLISAIVTAILAFAAAITHPEEKPEPQQATKK